VGRKRIFDTTSLLCVTDARLYFDQYIASPDYKQDPWIVLNNVLCHFVASDRDAADGPSGANQRVYFRMQQPTTTPYLRIANYEGSNVSTRIVPSVVTDHQQLINRHSRQ